MDGKSKEKRVKIHTVHEAREFRNTMKFLTSLNVVTFHCRANVLGNIQGVCCRVGIIKLL